MTLNVVPRLINMSRQSIWISPLLKPILRRKGLPEHLFRSFHKSADKSRPNVRKLFTQITVNAIGVCTYLLSDYSGYTKKLGLPSIFAAPFTNRREEFNFIADIAEISAPAVVYVEIRDTRRFNHLTGQHQSVSAGSGFFVQPDGLIVTNAHVVLQKLARNSPLKIVVKLIDGRTYDAEVEHVDRDADLATLRVPVKGAHTIKLGRSVGLKPGEFVLALGSPLALTNTVTGGVFSAYRKSTDLGLQKGGIVYIQTDTSINLGNSGGPLMNLEGEAIGINSMHIIPGISFATPIDSVSKFLEEARNNSKRLAVTNASKIRYLGVVMLSLSSDILTELNRANVGISPKVKQGVLLERIIAGSPAEEAGLHPGDIVTHVNGKEVKIAQDIYDVLAEKGRGLDLTIYRGMKQMRIMIKPDD